MFQLRFFQTYILVRTGAAVGRWVHQKFGHVGAYYGYDITFSRYLMYINPTTFETCGSHASDYEEWSSYRLGCDTM
jgi:hypothetical protein